MARIKATSILICSFVAWRKKTFSTVSCKFWELQRLLIRKTVTGTIDLILMFSLSLGVPLANLNIWSAEMEIEQQRHPNPILSRSISAYGTKELVKLNCPREQQRKSKEIDPGYEFCEGGGGKQKIHSWSYWQQIYILQLRNVKLNKLLFTCSTYT